MSKKKLFCILGRTSSGKSSLTKQVAEELNLKIIKSYATRPMRLTETVENSDHIFINKNNVEKFKDNMVAYTMIDSYEYFATKEQMLESDFYIIDPTGYYTLEKKLKSEDVELIPIYITLPKSVSKRRAEQRKDNLDVYYQRYADENEQFTQFEKSDIARYRVLNSGTFEESVEKLKRIVSKELGR